MRKLVGKGEEDDHAVRSTPGEKRKLAELHETQRREKPRGANRERGGERG